MKKDPYFDYTKEKFSKKDQDHKVPVEPVARESNVPVNKTFNSPLAEGIVWSEILSPPVSKRHGRGRRGI